ncbi:MAG: hypothetical protein AMXMBFR84_45940 [Candidatus Hydrogenedentota bacterium]
MRYALAMVCAGLLAHPGVAQAPQPAAQEAVAFDGIEVGTFAQEVRTFYTTADGLPSNDVTRVYLKGGAVFALTGAGPARLEGGTWVASADPGVSERSDIETLLATTQGGLAAVAGELNDRDWRQGAIAGDNRHAAVAAVSGLFLRDDGDDEWLRAFPMAGPRSWAPVDVRGVAYDRRGRLWFASPEGVGCLEGDVWTLYTGHDGLPFNDFTTVAAGEDGVVWFGTTMGAIRFDGKTWEYRQGPSWLPGDHVRSIVVDEEGDAWFATDGGVGLIERKPMTLKEKATYFSDELDRYNRRTPYGFVLEARLEKAGDKSKVTNHDSDNDGLWTAMYGAAECFRYAATKEPTAKERAMKAFEALRFLSEVTQGGEHPAPPGFPARSVLPIDGRNPNDHDTVENDKQKQERDPRWKILSPRWPVSADGKWYWKTDTSSDELDGHYFLYALCYDLVAETEEEKARVRETTLAVTDHLLAHDYALVDHDGTPTRWAQFGPKVLNYDMTSGGRGLNSISILSYLKVAYHMSGDEKYQVAYRDLIDNHAYAMNTLIPKTAMGPGNGNQSDDEMAFMGYYNLLNYEDDPELQQYYMRSLFMYFQLESPELCPLFNYIFAACLEGKNLRGGRRFIGGGILEEALDTLKRYRMDRIEWPLKNSHRIDLVKFSGGFGRDGGRGHRIGGKVLPIDERNVNHWNHDPWRLDYGGDGRELTDGSGFLLPYYMGLYHGFIVEK